MGLSVGEGRPRQFMVVSILGWIEAIERIGVVKREVGNCLWWSRRYGRSGCQWALLNWRSGSQNTTIFMFGLTNYSAK